MEENTMKAEELRIGNLTEQGRVVQLYVDDIVIFDGTAKWRQSAGLKIEPIPLTPEYLVRLGFKRGDNVTANDSFYVTPVGGSELGINPDNGVVWITRNENVFNNPALILFVHSIQNLYFALSGQELTLKP